MECDVAVLGGGPGGYTAAIRAAQLGAKTVCIEKEPELGGTCLRVGCIPTKAWVQTAFAIKEADETFAKLGVHVGEPQLDFATANQWKDGVVKQMTGGVAQLFKANGVEWVKGAGRFGREHDRGRGRGGRHVPHRHRRDRQLPDAAADRGARLTPLRRLDGLLAQQELPKRLVVLGGGIIGCEFASIFARFGSEVTIIEMLPSLIPQEDEDAAKELAKQFGKRNIALHLEKQCTKVEDSGSALTVHFGEGETVEADLMLVSVGRAPQVENLGLEELGVELDRRRGSPPTSTAAPPSSTSTPSATAPATGSSRTRPSARARSPRRTRWVTRLWSTTAPSPARSTRTPRSPASGSRSRRPASSTATTSRSGCSPGSRTPAP